MIEKTDLFYEGIAPTVNFFISASFEFEKTDLFYEGIALDFTICRRIGGVGKMKKLTCFMKGLRFAAAALICQYFEGKN